MTTGMHDFWAKLLTFWLPISKERRRTIRHRLRSHFVRMSIHKGVQIGEGVRFHEKSHLPPGSSIGDHTGIINLDVQGVGTIKIGRYSMISWDVLAVTSNHDFNGENIPFDHENIVKNIEIGDFCWIGARTMLLPGTKIGEGAIVQGGSVVHGTIPPLAICGGNPAKVFAYRDAEKFNRLKAEGKFFDTFDVN